MCTTRCYEQFSKYYVIFSILELKYMMKLTFFFNIKKKTKSPLFFHISNFNLKAFDIFQNVILSLNIKLI